MGQVRVTLKVDSADERSKAFIDFARTLDFVEIDEQNYQLSDAQRTAVEAGIESLTNSQSVAHEEAMRLTKEKFPHLFRND